MLGSQDLMRKAELDRLSSPEQLDLAMRVTSPAGWTALATIITGLLAVVAWSIFGRLPVEVDGAGMLLKGESVGTVQAPVAGRIVEILVETGDQIEADQKVAVLERTELESDISASKDRIEDLRRQRDRLRTSQEQTRRGYQAQLRGLRERLDAKKKLQERGFARRQDVLAIEGEMAQVQGQLLQLDSATEELGLRIREEKRNLDTLSSDRTLTISAKTPGQVAAVLAFKGNMIQAGGRILNLEAAGEPFRLVLYVELAEGKKVKPEMPVRIAPTTIKPEEYGYIQGKVNSVSAQPVTPEQVRSTLNNDKLVEQFTEGTPFEVIVDPDPDGDQVFEWTTPKGQALDIDSNTPCSARITVDEKAPIDLVVPFVLEKIGMG
ncbi:MAG: HlyD family efflux transporter periplasmic adaptor subunit [Holophagales bacterium]|nr:HlyD family efflux transporter periplasmic adaptor subunit [Holophagales bacterium]